MILVLKHSYKKSHPFYKELDKLCFLSKNLYNSTLYTVRQHYFETHKYLNYNAVNKLFTDNKQVDYCALPRKVSKMTQQLVDKSFKSFFALLKAKQKREYNEPINIPNYLDKVKGRQVVHYVKQALSFKAKEGFIKLSGTNIYIPLTNDITKDIVRYVRIVPKSHNIIDVEIGYKTEVPEIEYNNRIASIDLGINNLATVTSNVFSPFIINGKPLKSINQYYNKHLADLKSFQMLKGNKKSTNRIKALTVKRNNKVTDYMHKATRLITNHLVSNNISLLVIGYNKGWKQDVNMSKKNNQKFVQISFLKFINLLTYKCRLAGITVVTNEESYTSKCSFLDREPIQKHSTYLGRRVKRGLFRTLNKNYINADVNGSYNIMKKYLITQEAWNENIFSDCVEACSTPVVFTIK